MVDPLTIDELSTYMEEVRALVLEEIDRIIPKGTRYEADLYQPMRDYPFRPAKGLRPALCYAVCRAVGGRAEAVLPSAAVLELYHNAFLIHDDVEDGSWSRRDGPTLHTRLGMPSAVNIGDAMLSLCLRPLLDNTRLIGLGPALRVLRTVADMARESAEGQALELGWVRRRRFDIGDRDYLRMVYQKTTWYTFLTPIRVGGVIGGADPILDQRLRRWGILLGAAFQIQDDVLNCMADEREYGKEIGGDLWEGKHTLILGHLLRAIDSAERARVEHVLAKPRPRTPAEATPATKSQAEIDWLLDLAHRRGSVRYAQQRARVRAEAAIRAFDALAPMVEDSVHRDFLGGLTAYVHRRSR
jgi:geranylgeranyl diphosphate synthase type II